MRPDKIGIETADLKAFGSESARLADVFKKKLEGNFIQVSPDTTDEELAAKIATSRVAGVNFDVKKVQDAIPGVIKILRETIDVLKPKPKEEKKPEPIPEPEEYKTEIPNVKIDLKIVHNEQLDETSAANIKIREQENETKEGKEHILDDREVVNEISEKANKEVLMADFHPEEYIQAGLYTKEEVDRHNEEVKKLEAIYEEENTPEEKEIKKHATIFEAVVVKSINLSKCLGENVVARPAYPVDDLTAPKIDSYVILKKDIPLGLDVSMRKIEGKGFVEKIEKMLRAIKKGNPHGIKYYKDENGELKKDVHVPKVVISAEIRMIKELMYYFKNLPDDKFSEKLQSHRVSREVVSQIMGGSLAFANYAREIGQTDIANAYDSIRETIYKISEESPILKRLLNGAGHDPLSKKIQEIIVNFKKKEAIAQADLEEFRKSKNIAA